MKAVVDDVVGELCSTCRKPLLGEPWGLVKVGVGQALNVHDRCRICERCAEPFEPPNDKRVTVESGPGTLRIVHEGCTTGLIVKVAS